MCVCCSLAFRYGVCVVVLNAAADICVFVVNTPSLLCVLSRSSGCSIAIEDDNGDTIKMVAHCSGWVSDDTWAYTTAMTEAVTMTTTYKHTIMVTASRY